MLVRSTILFILLSIQLLLAAPINYFPNTGLEPRSETKPVYQHQNKNEDELVSVHKNKNELVSVHKNENEDEQKNKKEHKHEVKVEPRQLFDLVKLGVEVGTNKNVQSAVKQGAQTVASKIGGFFGRLFGHHK